jgi:hypothetical protein
MRNSTWLLGAVLLSACGPAGILSGKVTVEGGTAGGIAVIIYGPQSAATVTGDDGAFSVGSLPDGKYVVRATVRGADIEELTAPTTITSGKASPEPILAFRASTAKVTGTVVMADGSGAEDLSVTATGIETRGTRTLAGGAFTFDGLKTGAYLISVEAKDTREGRVAVGVNASGAISAGELRLTPIGRFGGTVTYNAMPVANAPVVVSGTSVSAVTDAMGKFQFVDVPTGNQSVNVRVGSAPFFRSATAMVTVLRGANPDVSISLTDDPPKTGTVTGTVTFHGPRTPRDISVSAPGSGVAAAMPQVNGAYSLTLPVGVWDVVANAPQHPTKLLGRVTVLDGSTQSLPGAEVSWYRPVWRSSSDISAPNGVGSTFLADTVPWSLVTFTDTTSRLALVNSTTYDFRILAAGSTTGHRVSKNGKYAAWYAPGTGTVFVYEIGTATLTTFAATQPVSLIEFSTDESAIFIQRTPLTLSRVKFSAPTNVETFPPSGTATEIQYTTVDRWFVRDTSNAIRLVTPANDYQNTFSNVSSFSAQPTAWAQTNCAVTCELWVLSPTSTSPALRDTSVNATPGTLSNFGVFSFDNRGDYPCFVMAGNAFCVRSSDGSHIALAGTPINFRLNEAGDRVIWSFVSGANRVLREEAMPPQTSTGNAGSNLVGWNTGWISPTRAIGYELSGAPRAMHSIKAGTDAVDNDIGSQAVQLVPPLIVFPQNTSSQWRAYVGDGPIRSIPVATNIGVVGTSARPLGTGAVTKYAMVSYDTLSAFILDENMAAVRPTAVGYALAGGWRSGSVELAFIGRPGGPRAFFVFNTNAIIEYQEGNGVTITAGIGGIGVLAYLSLAEDSRTIQVGSFLP